MTIVAILLVWKSELLTVQKPEPKSPVQTGTIPPQEESTKPEWEENSEQVIFLEQKNIVLKEVQTSKVIV